MHPTYIKQMLTDIMGEIDSNTIIGDFNTPLTSVYRSSTQKINKETLALNDTLEQITLYVHLFYSYMCVCVCVYVYIYKTFHPKAAEYTFFSSAYGTFSRIDHMLGHKTSPSKFKKTEIIPSFFPDHRVKRLEINYRGKKNCKKLKHMDVKQYATKQKMDN